MNLRPWSRTMKLKNQSCFIWCRLGTRKPFFLSVGCTEESGNAIVTAWHSGSAFTVRDYQLTTKFQSFCFGRRGIRHWRQHGSHTVSTGRQGQSPAAWESGTLRNRPEDGSLSRLRRIGRLRSFGHSRLKQELETRIEQLTSNPDSGPQS